MSKRVHFCRHPCSSGTACVLRFLHAFIKCQYVENPCIEIAKKIELHAHYSVVTWSDGGCVRVTAHSDRCTEGDYCIFVCEVMSTRCSKCIGDWLSLNLWMKTTNSKIQAKNGFNLIYGHFCVWVNKINKRAKLRMAHSQLHMGERSKKPRNHAVNVQANKKKSSQVGRLNNAIRSKWHRNKGQEKSQRETDTVSGVCMQSRMAIILMLYSLYRFVHEYFICDPCCSRTERERKHYIVNWFNLIDSRLVSDVFFFFSFSLNVFSIFRICSVNHLQ